MNPLMQRFATILLVVFFSCLLERLPIVTPYSMFINTQKRFFSTNNSCNFPERRSAGCIHAYMFCTVYSSPEKPCSCNSQIIYGILLLLVDKSNKLLIKTQRALQLMVKKYKDQSEDIKIQHIILSVPF